jgi:hypothetical protein
LGAFLGRFVSCFFGSQVRFLGVAGVDCSGFLSGVFFFGLVGMFWSGSIANVGLLAPFFWHIWIF